MAGSAGERAARQPETLLTTRYSLSGPFNDDPSGPSGDGSHVGGGIRVPTLRNLTRSAPYMHDGSRTTLEDAVRRHPGSMPPLGDQEIAELVAFLETLSE
jgi:cytochrome c peroxidase